MKGLLIFVMAVGMMFAVMGANTAMAGDPPMNTSKICKAMADTPYVLNETTSHGDCVSVLNSAVGDCKFLANCEYGFTGEGFLCFMANMAAGWPEYESVGECVSDK